MDPSDPENVPTPLSRPVVSTDVLDRTPGKGYRDGNLKSNASPDARRERAERDTKRRLTEAERTYSHARQRHDLNPTAASKRALAEADAAYRTAAQAVRELDVEPDTPVPRNANSPRPSFVDKASRTLGRE